MEPKILSVTAVTDNFPDGQKLVAAYVKTNGDVRPEQLRVEGHTVKAVRQEKDTVILELEPRGLIPPPPAPPKKPEGAPPPKKHGPPNLPPAVRLEPEVTVIADGVAYKSEKAIEPVVEDFQQFELNGMWYNLYIPALEAGKTYPLVLFIHDAGGCGPNPKTTLSQGNGAVGFASAAWQKAHPCFVLAPQVDKHPYGPMTDDDFNVTPDFDRLKKILEHVLVEYPVDMRRIYTTGQSMGCMASCELNIRCPDLFAASLLVAGQWSPERMAANCSKNKLWILVSEGDTKALPGMNAVTEAMEANGAKVGRYRWDAKASADELDRQIQEAVQDDVNVRYTVLTGDSVLPEGCPKFPGVYHMATWPVVYEMDGLKDWLFSNSK